jgi:hypothetical protein
MRSLMQFLLGGFCWVVEMVLKLIQRRTWISFSSLFGPLFLSKYQASSGEAR